LDDVRPRGLEVARLGIDGGGEVHGQLVEVTVELVLRLLGHGEGAGQGDLGEVIGMAAKELHVAELDGLPPSDPAHDARHRRLVARPVPDDAGTRHVDALQRGREAVRVALAPDLTVRDDVDARPFHVPDGDHRGIILRLLQPGLGDPPHALEAHARDALRQHRAVDKPVGLGIATHHRGRQHLLRHRFLLRHDSR
jgi:hypothetical protein